MTSKSKSIRLALKDFDAIPQHLIPAAGAQPHVPEISVSLTKLMHHMFIDTFDDGRSGDQGYMDLYGPMFAAGRSLRVRGNGLGSHKEAKVGESQPLRESLLSVVSSRPLRHHILRSSRPTDRRTSSPRRSDGDCKTNRCRQHARLSLCQ